MHIAHYQRHRLFWLSIGYRIKPKAINAKSSPAGRKVGRSQLFCRCAHIFIIEAEVYGEGNSRTVPVRSRSTRKHFDQNQSREKPANVRAKRHASRSLMDRKTGEKELH